MERRQGTELVSITGKAGIGRWLPPGKKPLCGLLPGGSPQHRCRLVVRVSAQVAVTAAGLLPRGSSVPCLFRTCFPSSGESWSWDPVPQLPLPLSARGPPWPGNHPFPHRCAPFFSLLSSRAGSILQKQWPVFKVTGRSTECRPLGGELGWAQRRTDTACVRPGCAQRRLVLSGELPGSGGTAPCKERVKLYKPCARSGEALQAARLSLRGEEKATEAEELLTLIWRNALLEGGVWEAGGRRPSAPVSLGAMSTRAVGTSAAALRAADSLHPPLLALGGAGREGARSCVCQPQMPAAAQSWDNCSYLFLLFSRPRRGFQERTFRSMMTCKRSPSIYVSNSKSAVSKFEPGLRRIMGQMQLAARRAAQCSLIYFFAHQIPRIPVLKSN